MPTFYVRKTTRAKANKEMYERAFESVTSTGESLRKTAQKFGVNYMSLKRFARKKRTGLPVSIGYANRGVFTDEEEVALVAYAVTRVGTEPLKMINLRRYAYDFAQQLDKKCPPSWHKHKKAGEAWQKLFVRRHPEIRRIGSSAALEPEPVDPLLFKEELGVECEEVNNQQ